MTGPDHFRTAEDLLKLAETEPETSAIVATLTAAAQVHATLALAAATVECASDLTPPQEWAGNGNYITQGVNAKAWQEALS